MLWASRQFWILRKSASPFPLAAWLPGLVERHGEPEARRLAALAEQRCRALIAGMPPQASPALRAQWIRNIYPGLALYQTLLEAHQGDRQAALAEIEPLFKTWTLRLYGGMMRAFHFLPFPFFFFRLMFAIQRRQLADNIFQTRMLEDSFHRIAMDQFGCPYLSTLSAHGAAELTPYFCQIDDWMAEMLPRQIAFRRTKTLARGDDRCDFRYEKTD
jgi:hypothetical protein